MKVFFRQTSRPLPIHTETELGVQSQRPHEPASRWFQRYCGAGLKLGAWLGSGRRKDAAGARAPFAYNMITKQPLLSSSCHSCRRTRATAGS